MFSKVDLSVRLDVAHVCRSSKLNRNTPLMVKNDGEKSKAILTKSHYHNRMSSDKESIKCIHAQEALPSDIRIEEKKEE